MSSYVSRLQELQTSITMVLSFRWGHEVRNFFSLKKVVFAYIWSLHSILFVVWDVADDKFFHKTNDSDATQFAILYPRISAHGMRFV